MQKKSRNLLFCTFLLLAAGYCLCSVSSMTQAEYPLMTVARRTGLSPQLIRAWESRHAAVSPHRSENGRRLYWEADIERLTLLRSLTGMGLPISRLAHLPTPELDNLARREQGYAAESRESSRRLLIGDGEAARFVTDALAAISRLDSEALLNTFDAAEVALGRAAFLEKVVAPLAEQVGKGWRAGHLKIAHEHFATAQLRGYLGAFGRVPRMTPATPHLLVTTPPEQWHELGALLVAAAAHSHGWRVSYLGPSLPVEEIAGAAIGYTARAVALSIVHPEDDPHMERELVRLHRLLPEGTGLLIGGRGSSAYGPVFVKIGARHLSGLSELYPVLDELRRHPLRVTKRIAKSPQVKPKRKG
jgi:DNA-binding transcriptional MerR regulator